MHRVHATVRWVMPCTVASDLRQIAAGLLVGGFYVVCLIWWPA